MGISFTVVELEPNRPHKYDLLDWRIRRSGANEKASLISATNQSVDPVSLFLIPRIVVNLQLAFPNEKNKLCSSFNIIVWKYCVVLNVKKPNVSKCILNVKNLNVTNFN